MYRHAPEPLSLVFAIIFIGAAIQASLYLSGDLSASTTRFVVPIVLIASGAAGLAASISRQRRSGPVEERSDRRPDL